MHPARRDWRPAAADQAPIDVAIEFLFSSLAAAARWVFRRLTRPWRSALPAERSGTRRNAPPLQLHQTVRPAPGRSRRADKFPKAPPPPIRSRPRAAAVFPAPADLPPPLAYRPAKRLMSKGEYAFWVPLYRAVRGRYRLFCKDRLADIVRSPERPAPGQKGFGSIKGYHVDFVLCDPETTAPLLVVELDDKSHAGEQQRRRDEFKDRVLASAGIPVYRLPAQIAYDEIEIRERIDALLADRRA